jgi:TPR repeat protein
MYEKAPAFYSAAIKTGCTEAIVHLALFYHYRLQDYKKAIKFYTIALKKGELRYAAVNLGILYQNILKDYANAERYYLLAAKKGHAGAMNGLAWVYFEQQQHKQKALHYAKQASDKEKTMYTAHTLACIYLWNNRPEEAVRVAQEFMYDKESYTAINQDILLYLMLLLAKQQYDYLTEYFEAPELNLQERFKPLYYAFLYHIHDPDYYKRPPELIEPIGGIIGQVQRLAASYS